MVPIHEVKSIPVSSMNGIKGQLLKAFLSVIAILSCTTISIVFLNLQITQQYKMALDVMVSEYQLLESGATLNETFNTIMLSYGTDAHEADQQLLDAKNNIKVQKLFLEENINTIQSKANYIGFAASIDEFTNLVDDGVTRFRAGNIDSYFDDYNAATKQFEFVQINGTTLLLGELKYVTTIRDQLSTSYKNTLLTGIILLIVLVTSCILYVLGFSKKFVLPLRNLTTAATKLAAGETDVRIEKELLSIPNETGILANSFDKMAISLQDKVSRLNQSNEEIAQSVQKFESKNAQLEKLNQFMVDRELKMIELKNEIKSLKGE